MEMQERMTLPTIIPVGKNFKPGKGLKIRCMVTPGASRFTITLFCGQDITVQEDAALNVSFNLTSNNTTINSKRNGTWDRECAIEGIPFDHSDSFEVLLLCDQSLYKLFINGNYFSEFQQNISYDKITFMAVKGDVTIEQIGFESGCSFQLVFDNATAYKLQYPITQQVSYDPTVIPLNVTCITERRISINWKVYAVYGGIALLVLIIVLCIVFLPKYGSNHDYDFD